MRNVLFRGSDYNQYYNSYETSVDKGEPIELYMFTYGGTTFSYTSSYYTQYFNYEGQFYRFESEYIKRSDSLKLGNNDGTIETCIITVPRSNNVSLLYQGAPPEDNSVRVDIFRYHDQLPNTLIRICSGTVSQVHWRDSYAELTITIENVFHRNIPRHSLSYWCQNCIYDDNCFLKKEDWGQSLYADGGLDNLVIVASGLLPFPDGYFTDGFIEMGSCKRAVKLHSGQMLQLKYPIPQRDMSRDFIVYPGCNYSFKECHVKFKNTENFSGVPYIQPYNAFTHPVSKGAYWYDGILVQRDTGGDHGGE